MIDKWLKQDLDLIFKNNKVAVLIDESKHLDFLKDKLKNDYNTYEVNNELEELKVKYEIEKNDSKALFNLIYTTNKINDLKFTREYCEIYGNVQVPSLSSYTKNKVFEITGKNINLESKDLHVAAIQSVGKSQEYWEDLINKGSSRIFDLKNELLIFLDNPTSYFKDHSNEEIKLFYDQLSELFNIELSEKPPETIAEEITSNLFESLLNNNILPEILEIYESWVDSKSYEKSFKKHLDIYKIKDQSFKYKPHPSHPFKQVDYLWLKELSKSFQDKEYISNVLPDLTKRRQNKIAKHLGISFWEHIELLLKFNYSSISRINSFNDAIEFYKKDFYKLDYALRSLYTEFINDVDIIEPIQSYYSSLLQLFLDKWFTYFNEYKSNQTEFLNSVLSDSNEKVAIVIGDGISWDFAKEINVNIDSNDIMFNEDNLLAGVPSVTINNMSKIYTGAEQLVSEKKKREQIVQENFSNKSIQFVDLEGLPNSLPDCDVLVVSCKDPDNLGESKQQDALKYFKDISKSYSETIRKLLHSGFNEVILTTDHGFVLTGLLFESSKIDVVINGDHEKNERYILTKERQKLDESIFFEIEKSFKDYNYCYFAKRIGPFKTPGKYGFSHGGILPQEIVIPNFNYKLKEIKTKQLEVTIANKEELQGVVSELFEIKIKGNNQDNTMFAMERRIMIQQFHQGKLCNESDIIKVTSEDLISREYPFNGMSEIKVLIIDSQSKKTLDEVIVKKNQIRNLGGLL